MLTLLHEIVAGVKFQILWKKTQVHLMTYKGEWSKNILPLILKNLNKFSPSTFYSTPCPPHLGSKEW